MATQFADVEAILSQFLRGQPEVAGLVADRVYTDLPHAPDRSYPLVLLTRTGSAYSARSYLEVVAVRLDVYGLNHAQAWAVVAACMSVLADRLVGRYPQPPVTAVGAVTGVTLVSLAYEPDPDTVDEAGHARPRYVAAVEVHAHA